MSLNSYAEEYTRPADNAYLIIYPNINNLGNSVCIHFVSCEQMQSGEGRTETTGLKFQYSVHLHGGTTSSYGYSTAEFKCLCFKNRKRNETVVKSTEKANPDLKINHTRERVSRILALG